MKLYAEITKYDEASDGTLEVHGIASTEAQDSQGEVVKSEAIRDAIPEFMRHGTGPLREMHQPLAAGNVMQAQVDDDGITRIVAKVVDPIAILKVKEGVYKGFSIGGRSLSKAEGVISRMKLTEISLVDRPANPECTIDLFKADDLGDESSNDDQDDDQDDNQSAAEEIGKKDFSTEQRKESAKKGHAMPDGSYPIENKDDLKNAIQAFGRAKNKAATKKHIISRAKALKATDLLPSDWEGSTKDEEKSDMSNDINKYLGEEAWDAGRAIEALGVIYMLYAREVGEQENMPDQLAALKAVIDGLKAFIASEISEPSDFEEDESAEPIEMSNMPFNLLKVADMLNDGEISPEYLISLIEADALAKAATDASGDIEKAGSRHNKLDAATIQKMHDHAASLGATCMAKDDMAMSDNGGDIAKLNGELEIAKAEAAAWKEKWESRPNYGNAFLRATTISKEADNGKADPAIDIAKSLESMSDTDKATALIKLIHQSGGVN